MISSLASGLAFGVNEHAYSLHRYEIWLIPVSLATLSTLESMEHVKDCCELDSSVNGSGCIDYGSPMLECRLSRTGVFRQIHDISSS